MSGDIILSPLAGDGFLRGRVGDTLLGHLPDLRLTGVADDAKFINAGGEDRFWGYGLAICLRQIDLLSRPKDSALPGLYIGRYSPQPQSHIERIEAQRGPEGKLADPMLFRMAGGA